MSCPDCDFVHEINQQLVEDIGAICKEKGKLEGIAAQNKVWASSRLPARSDASNSS